MQASVNTLFTPAQRQRLIPAVRMRTSIRAYDGALSPEETAALSYHAGRFTLPGAHLTLLPVPQNTFTNITGCTMAAALLVTGDSWLHRLNAGVIGEAFVLEATAMGLGTCWVAGSWRREAVRVPRQAEETLLCLIAVGRPAQKLIPPATRPRMAPEQLCRGNWRQWPEQLIRAATLVQQAPSGMNQQPWTLMLTPAGDFALDAPIRSALDAGVALCHAELALDTPHTWRFSDAPGAPLAVAAAE